MKKIRIYQSDNRNYTFMNYKFALDHGFNLDDYKQVADIDDDDTSDDLKILDKIFMIGNDGTLTQHIKMRSISVSDIIQIDDRKYYVDSFGFKQIIGK